MNDVRNQLVTVIQEKFQGIYLQFQSQGPSLPANVVGSIHVRKAHTLEGTQNILAKDMQSDNGIRKQCKYPVSRLAFCHVLTKSASKDLQRGNAVSCQQHEHPARCHPGHAKLGTAYQTV